MRTVWDKFRQIVDTVGLPAPKSKRNLFHKLRRTTITYCAKIDPAIAQRTAGHRDYATTLRSYVDQTIVRIPSAADVLFDPLKTPRTVHLRIVG
jgi:integrase